MMISGPGSTVTVAAAFTGIGVFGPGALTISNGGVLNSQGGAEVDSSFGGPRRSTVTGPGSHMEHRRLGLSVGGGTTGGPGMLTISNGGVVNTNVAFMGDGDRRLEPVLVTGAGSGLTRNSGSPSATRLRLRPPDRNAHHRRRRRGQLPGFTRIRRRQHAQSRHRRARRRDHDAGDRQRRPDRRELHRHAHPRRRYLRHRHAEQGRGRAR